MTLDAELTEYYKPLAPTIGFKVLIHEENELPLVEGNGFAVMPGVATFVAIKKNKVKSMHGYSGPNMSPTVGDALLDSIDGR